MHSSSFTSLLCPKRFALAVFGSLVLLLAGAAQAQTTFDWFNTAPDGNWKQGAAGARWTGGLWDEPSFGILRFNNNNQLNMTNNVAGTYSMHGLNFGSFNTSTRTLGGNTVRLFDFGGADPHIINDSSATHIINLNLEGDGDGGDPLKINLNSSGGLTFGGTINNQGSWVDVVGSTGSSVSATFNGVISGSGGLYKNNANTTAVLAADNLYSGGTTIDAGTLQVGSGGSAGSLGSGNVTNNGALVFNRASGAPNNFILTNAISGSGTLTQNGGNIITISSANTYTGATTINSGTLRVTANEALGTGAAGTTVNSGGALLLSGATYSTAEALSINGTGVGGNGALRNNLGSSTYAGQVTAASNATINVTGVGESLTLTGGVVKNGTVLTIKGSGSVIVNNTGISGASAGSDLVVDGGNLVVNAASNYNGPTTVQNSGTLAANAAITTTEFNLNTGTTLSGSASINAGAGNVYLNGTFVAGNAAGGAPREDFAITAGSTIADNGATLKFDLFSRGGDLTSTPSAADTLLITGNLSLLSSVVLEISSALSGWAAGDKWNIWDASGTTTGTIATINAPALGNPLLGWQFTESTGILEIIAVPEPTKALFAFFGLFGLMMRRRRA